VASSAPIPKYQLGFARAGLLAPLVASEGVVIRCYIDSFHLSPLLQSRTENPDEMKVPELQLLGLYRVIVAHFVSRLDLNSTSEAFQAPLVAPDQIEMRICEGLRLGTQPFLAGECSLPFPW
jgi:hypothetical protein